jgi:hypothetical protein
MALKNTWATGEAVTAGDLNATADEIMGINASGVYASRPAAGHPGRTYDCTDNGNRYRDNGTSWDLISVAGSGIAGTEPPTSGWTAGTLGTSTVGANLGGRLFTGAAGDGTDLRVEYRTLASGSNFTATAHVDLTAVGVNFVTAGLILRNAAGNIIHFGPAFNGGWAFRVSKFTSTAAFSADYNAPALSAYPQGTPNWYRIIDDGTNRIFRFSHDGATWVTLYTGSRTDFLTATQIGWCCLGPSAAGSPAVGRMRSFSVV